jgi:hypothetical protein
MTKLMYVALLPLAILAIAMFTRATPEATASLSKQSTPAIDIQEMHRAVDMNTLPNGDTDPEYLK